MSTLVFASVQTYGEIFTLSNPGTAASVHARQDIPLVYTRIDGVAAPAGETIAALTYAATLTSGATFDQTLCDWAIVTHTGTGALLVVPLQTVIALPALIASGTYAILAWITRDRIYPWPQIAIPSMTNEGDTWFNHSTGDPTDPTTPPTPTVLPVGGIGQLMTVIPDADDPHQVANATADPAYTLLPPTEGLVLTWQFPPAANPSVGHRIPAGIALGTAGQIFTVRPATGGSGHGPYDNLGAYATSVDEPSWEDIAWVLAQHLLANAGELVTGVGGGSDAATLTPGADKTILRSHGTGAALTWETVADALKAVIPNDGQIVINSGGSPVALDPPLSGTDRALLAIDQNVASTPFWFAEGGTGVPAFPVLTSSGFIWLPRPTNTSVLVFDTAGHFNWVDMSTPGDLLVNIGGSIQVLGAPSGPSVLTFASGVVTWLTNTGGGDKFVKIDSTSGPHLV